MDGEHHVFVDDGCGSFAHEFWAVVAVALTHAQLNLAVFKVGHNGPGLLLLPVCVVAPVLIGVVQLHPEDAIIKQPKLVEVLGDVDGPLVLHCHITGKLALRQLLQEQNVLVGFEPVALLRVEVLVLGQREMP